jgi:hypothetical protein
MMGAGLLERKGNSEVVHGRGSRDAVETSSFSSV